MNGGCQDTSLAVCGVAFVREGWPEEWRVPVLVAEGRPMYFRAGDQTWPIRLCAIRKSRLAAERAQRKARRKAQTHQHQVSAEALELSKYVLVLTTLAPQSWSAAQVLELYRCRWQIKLAFKRLKSLLQLGQLPKQDPASARAWLQLKLLLALIMERLCHQARFFSPWGYRLALEPLAGVAGDGGGGAHGAAGPAVAA
jgi:hypothetical protein